MKIATYNVNGVNRRLPVLLRWLEEAQPDIVCLQELKVPQEKFPEAAIRDAGYHAIWQGQKSWNGVAILAKGQQPQETRRGLPGDPEDLHSRYIEAEVNGIIIGCLYRKLTVLLRTEGRKVNAKRVLRLLRLMGLQAIYQKPYTSKPHPAHPVYPYLLTNLPILRPNRVWATDIT